MNWVHFVLIPSYVSDVLFLLNLQLTDYLLSWYMDPISIKYLLCHAFIAVAGNKAFSGKIRTCLAFATSSGSSKKD